MNNYTLKDQFESVILHWWEISRCRQMLDIMWSYAKGNRGRHPQYEQQFKSVSRFVVSLADSLQYKMPIKIDRKQARKLVWLILTLPLGETENQTIPFLKIKLDPIMLVYRKIFLKLLEESYAVNIVKIHAILTP